MRQSESPHSQTALFRARAATSQTKINTKCTIKRRAEAKNLFLLQQARNNYKKSQKEEEDTHMKNPADPTTAPLQKQSL
ncbi:MAG: hypothetical protein DBX55_04360 [Verrucomicrobia bacterium]|nr:MAG: hypothetical protein DBX55_04360 [Verrucomicrobiota bacterium]